MSTHLESHTLLDTSANIHYPNAISKSPDHNSISRRFLRTIYEIHRVPADGTRLALVQPVERRHVRCVERKVVQLRVGVDARGRDGFREGDVPRCAVALMSNFN